MFLKGDKIWNTFEPYRVREDNDKHSIGDRPVSLEFGLKMFSQLR
jgi:hypothetical protein